MANTALPIFDVRHYGAKGDGTTDDSVNIQKCVTAAIASSPSEVVFPRGVYIIQDPTLADYSTQNDGPIYLPVGTRDVRIRGEGAILRVGPNGISTAAIRIFGSRCVVSGLTIDVDANVSDDPDRKDKGSSGIEINGSHGSSTADDAKDNELFDCYYINGYTGDDAENQGSEGFVVVNGVNNRVNLCHVIDGTWSGFRFSGDGNQCVDCTCYNQRGNGIRILQGDSVEVRGFRCSSTRCHGRSAIICDAGSSAGIPALRTTRLMIAGCECYANPDGTGRKPHGGTVDGAASCLKIAAASDVVVRDSYFGAGNATDNYAMRLEDCVRNVTFENVVFEPNVIFTPADNDESSVYQGLVSSVANNGGKCRITLSGTGNPDNPSSPTSGDGEGLFAGKSLFIMGSAISAYNREHIVQARQSDYVFDTDIDFVSTVIGSVCFARSGVDRVTFRNCHFGGSTFGVNGVSATQDTPFLENVSCRVLDMENCTFDQLGARTLTFNAIEWECTSDNGFEMIRLVNNDFTFNTDATSSHVGRMINPKTSLNSTVLVTSGKTVSYGNKLVNIGLGGAVFANSAAANANRQILFSTDGESRNRFRWTATPATGDSLTTFATGDVVVNSTASSSPFGWVCVTAGAPGTFLPSGVNGTLVCNVTEVGNVGVGEDNLITYTLPANTLSAAGASLEIDAAFTFANNTASKQVKLYLGSSNIFASGSLAHQFGSMHVKAIVVRDVSNISKVSVVMNSSGSNVPFPIGYANVFNHTADLTTALTIKGTGEATNNNDIVMEYLRVRVFQTP